MLDEPASGLNHAEVGQLADQIRALRDDLDLTVLLVEHNMGLVMGLCEQVVVLDVGRKIAEGAPREVQDNKRVVEAYLGAPA
jgi:branched-chain amino acid transport system ATP-binding protein